MHHRIAQLCLTLALVATLVSSIGCKLPPPTSPRAVAREPNELLWGDTHVRTGARSVDVDTAYRFARGLPVVHPSTRARVQLRRPLDFAAVTEPAEDLDEAGWARLVDAAERHNVPCAFTTFIGWEWSSEPEGHSLHRVVLMNEGEDEASQMLPFGADDGPQPEDLWEWLAETSARVGTDFLAIPSGPNLSGGMMYPEVEEDDSELSARNTQLRARWEPVSEVTQIRGDSETHPTLSPDDDFADFERFPLREGRSRDSSALVGSYARSALLRGLRIEQKAKVNPFEFGMIGSTGADTGLAAAEESQFWAAFSKSPNTSTDSPPSIADLSAQGLAAAWVEENTRAFIFDAFKRKEVYATTGPRIRVRFFGGWEFDEKQAHRPNMVQVGYTFGRPMGSELPPRPEARKPKVPGFLMYAMKDPSGAPLDRIQLVKGWVDEDGAVHEKVYDVVWSAGRERESDGSVPPVRDPVDLRMGRGVDVEGAAALRGFWSDPNFDPEQPAFYYLRVLQVPTARHTLYDAIAHGADPKATGHPPTIQERAYTSPIWYRP